MFLCPFSWFPRYEKSRRLRVAIIHGIARMATLMASTYKAYLGVGLSPLSVGFLVNCTVKLMVCIACVICPCFERGVMCPIVRFV